MNATSLFVSLSSIASKSSREKNGNAIYLLYSGTHLIPFAIIFFPFLRLPLHLR